VELKEKLGVGKWLTILGSLVISSYLMSDEMDKGGGVKRLNFFHVSEKISLGPVGVLGPFQKVIALDFPKKILFVDTAE